MTVRPVRNWDTATLDTYTRSCIRGMTLKQIAHMAWYLGVVSEGMMRDKELAATERAEDDGGYDDPYFGMKE